MTTQIDTTGAPRTAAATKKPRIEFVRVEKMNLSAEDRRSRTLMSILRELTKTYWTDSRDTVAKISSDLRERDFKKVQAGFRTLLRVKGADKLEIRELAEEGIRISEMEMGDLVVYAWIAVGGENLAGICRIEEGTPPTKGDQDSFEADLDEEGQFTNCTVFWKNGLFTHLGMTGEKVVQALMHGELVQCV